MNRSLDRLPPLGLLGLVALSALSACNSSLAADPLAPSPTETQGLLQSGPVIKSLESDVGFAAQFNPKEIDIDKPVSWQQHKNSQGDAPTLEFTSGEGRSLSVELMFDGFEQKTDVSKTFVSKLEKLADVDPALGRPPMVLFTWGGVSFQGVIAHEACKYTLFLDDGRPVRAICNVRLLEAYDLWPPARRRH